MNLDFNKSPVEAFIIMESIGEPCKPEIKKVVETANNFFVRFRTCLQTFDVFNRNGRNYFGTAMRESFAAPHIQELIKKGDWCGHAGHPDSDDPKIVLTIDPKLVCHRILNYEFIGNKVYADIETLNDDLYGRQFTKHILQGLEPAFSLRALAPVTKIDARRGVVKSKSHIVTYDRVFLPSHIEAYRDESSPIALAVPPMSRISTTESCDSFKVMESAAIDFILQESSRVKTMIDVFEIAYESINFTSDRKAVVMRDTRDNKIYNVSLESYVDMQVGDCLAKLI